MYHIDFKKQFNKFFVIKVRSFNRHVFNLFLACSDLEVIIIISRVLAKFTFPSIIHLLYHSFSTIEICLHSFYRKVIAKLTEKEVPVLVYEKTNIHLLCEPIMHQLKLKLKKTKN